MTSVDSTVSTVDPDDRAGDPGDSTDAPARTPVLTRSLPPAAGESALDPLAQEVSFVALRMVGADPLAIRSDADLRDAARVFARLLDVASIPGRTLAFVDLATRPDPGGATRLDVHLVLGVCGERDSTAGEAGELAVAAMQALAVHPAPYQVAAVDPAGLLDVDAAHGALVTQRTVSLADEREEATVVSRFDAGADDWLALVGALRERSAQTRVRATLLATSLTPDDHLALQRQLGVVRSIAMRADGDPAVVNRAQRIEVTLLDLVESFASQVWIGEISVTSGEPLSEVLLRTVASSFTNELDVVQLSEYGGMATPTVAARRRLVGGYGVERDPAGLADALRAGLPLAGGGRPRRLADLVSPTEAALLLRWPVPAGRAVPTITTRAARALPAPPGLPATGTLVGRDPTGVAIRLPDQARARHTHVIGVTGAGKTSLLVCLAADDVRRGLQVVYIDPHGDGAARVRAAAAETGSDLFVVDPAEEGSGAIALFEGIGPGGARDAELIERSVARIVDAVTSHLPADYSGPRFRVAARAALTLLAYAGEGERLHDVARLLSDDAYQNRLLHGYRGPAWVKSELSNFQRLTNRADMIDWVSSKFSDLCSRGAARRVIAPIGAGSSIAGLLAQGRSVVVNLAQGLLSALDTALLGHLVLSATIDAALEGRPDARPRVGLYCDELHLFPAHNLERGLQQGRKFGLGMVLAHQNLSQLPPTTRDALLGGAATRFAFRLAPDDASYLAALLDVPARDLASQPDLHAYARILGESGDTPSCSVLVPHPGPLPEVEPLPVPESASGGAESTSGEPDPDASGDDDADGAEDVDDTEGLDAHSLIVRSLRGDSDRLCLQRPPTGRVASGPLFEVRAFDDETVSLWLDADGLVYETPRPGCYRVVCQGPGGRFLREIEFRRENTMLHARVQHAGKVRRREVPDVLVRLNEWNGSRRFPRAHFVPLKEEKPDGPGRVVLTMNLDLEFGVHAALLADWCRWVVRASREFWVWYDGQPEDDDEGPF